MLNKLYWGMGVLFVLLIIGATVFVLVKDRTAMRQPETELETLQEQKEDQNTTEVSKEDQNTTEVSIKELPEHGHFPEDDTFPVGEHDDPTQTPSRDYPQHKYRYPMVLQTPKSKLRGNDWIILPITSGNGVVFHQHAQKNL